MKRFDEITGLRWLLLVAVFLLVSGAGNGLANATYRGARSPTTVADAPEPPAVRRDLAALALSPSDLAGAGLDGFGLRASAMLTGEEQAARLAPDTGLEPGAVNTALTAAGFERGYWRQLGRPQRNEGPSSRLRALVESTLLEFAAPDGAAAGLVLLAASGANEMWRGVAPAEFGEDAEIRRFQAVTDSGEAYQALALTFRWGDLDAKVALGELGDREPDQVALESLGRRLLVKMRAAAVAAGPGLSNVALRLADAETRSDEYGRLNGETFPNYGESAETLADRVERYGNAIDVFGVAQGTGSEGLGRGDDVRYLMLLYRFADEDQAAVWMAGGLDRASGLPNAIAATAIAGAETIGDASLTLSTTVQRSGVGAVRGALIYARVGSSVSQVQLLGIPEIPLASVAALARAQVTCLRLGDCPERVALPMLLSPSGSATPAGEAGEEVKAPDCAEPVAAQRSDGAPSGSTSPMPVEAADPTKKAPNFIVIVTDDLDARAVGCMPNVRRLLQGEGISFRNAFVTTPLCCPSRASLLRGQYAHNHGVLDNSGAEGGFPTFHRLGDEHSTLATWLQDAGYRTALFGKYLNRYPKGASTDYVPPGWDEWAAFDSGAEEDEGGSYFSDYTLNINGTLVSYGHQPEEYSTDVLAFMAAAVVDRADAAGQPFFVYLAPYAPHGPSTPAPRHSEAFGGAIAPRMPSFDEADVGDKPAWVRAYPPLTGEQIALIDDRYRRRLRSLLAVDEMVAMLVDTLRATGTLEDTYIIVTSDNGFHLGEHRLPLGKQSAYDESIRVPLIVRGPGVPAGVTRNQIALNIDLAPTIAALAGVAAPEFVDGRSLAPLLRGSAEGGWRRGFLVERYDSKREGALPAPPEPASTPSVAGGEGVERIGPAAAPPYRALRTEGYLFVVYDSGERELYDLHRDPYQLENLAEVAAPELLAQLGADLEAMSECVAAGCWEAEAALPG